MLHFVVFAPHDLEGKYGFQTRERVLYSGGMGGMEMVEVKDKGSAETWK